MAQIELAIRQYFSPFVESKETTFRTLRIIWKTIVWWIWNHGKRVEISLQWQHLIPWGSSPALFCKERKKIDNSSPEGIFRLYEIPYHRIIRTNALYIFLFQ
jgi:hypothetical protein